MSDKINDGGPAFPQNEFSAFTEDRQGMSVRVHIASMVMQSVMAGSTGLGTIQSTERKAMFAIGAAICFEVADAIIAEAAKPSGAA